MLSRPDGCVSWFLRLHPLLDAWVASNVGFSPNLRAHGEVVSIDLTLDDATFNAGLRKGHRSDIKRGEADGVRVRRGDHGADLDAFVTLHEGTMAQRDAAEYHRFGPDYFAALAEGLGDDLVVLLAELDGAVVARRCSPFAASSGAVGVDHEAGELGGVGGGGPAELCGRA
jgi:hypothetical protein